MYLKDCKSNIFKDNDIDNVTKFIDDYNLLLKKAEESDNSRRYYRYLCNNYDNKYYSNNASSNQLKCIKESRDNIHKKAIKDLEDFISLDKKCSLEKNELINNCVDYKLDIFNEFNKNSKDLLYRYAALESSIYKAFLTDYDNYIFYREYNKKNNYKYIHDNSDLIDNYNYLKSIYPNYEKKSNKVLIKKKK